MIMKAYTSSFVFLLFCFCINSLSAQLPDNFEFLNHQVRGGELGATKLFNDELYFVNHNTFFISQYDFHPDPYFTTVYKVNAQNEVEVIFRTYDISQSFIIENPDASFDIILYQLIDVHMLSAGFISINVDSNSIKIDTITPANNGIAFDEYIIPEDIHKNEDGDWIISSLATNASDYYIFDESGLVGASDYINLTFYELVNNSDQELFGLSFSDSSEHTIVYRLIDGATDSIAVIEEATMLESLHNDESGNYLISSDALLQFSGDFSQLINAWELDKFGGSITSISSFGGSVEVLVDQDRLYRLQSNGDIDLIAQDLNVPDETITYFQRLDDEQILFGGEHDFETITENVYFRNVNVVDNSNVEYPRVDVAIEDVEVLHNSQDLTTRIKLNITNRGNEQVEVVDFYSRLYDPQAPITFRRFMDLIFTDLDVNESIAIDTTIFIGTDDMSFVIPGGDYRFNASQDGFWLGDIMSSTADLDVNNSLRISPNPCNDFIHIETQGKIKSIGIYNELGQIVYYKSSQTKTVDNAINVSHLDSGLYFLAVTFEGFSNVSSIKFVKE